MDNMDNKVRVRWTVSVDPDLLENLKKLSGKTRIATSRLADEAIEDLLLKHNAIESKTKTP